MSDIWLCSERVREKIFCFRQWITNYKINCAHFFITKYISTYIQICAVWWKCFIVGDLSLIHSSSCVCNMLRSHIMDMLWEKFQWILPLYMKPISFQSKASVVCSVTAAVFIDFFLNKLNVFSQHIGQKTNEYLNSTKQIAQELKCWSTFYVNYFLRYYLMMQHQPIVKRVNDAHEWAHRPYQSQSAPYHCCLYKHRRLDERQPPQTRWLVPICT